MTRSVAACFLLFTVAVGHAVNHQVALDEVLASWQGDDTAQFVELRMLGAGQNQLAGQARLVIDAASGDQSLRRSFTFQPPNPANAVADGRILVATTRLAEITGLAPDYVLPTGVLSPDGGRVCYVVGDFIIDCVAWGPFRGDTAGLGRPSPFTPDNRSLQRVEFTGTIRTDWTGVLEPTPTNNQGKFFVMQTLCDGTRIDQGEDCDGDVLGGETCASLGFVKGKLKCRQCHFDTGECTQCGNDTINRGEQCDGSDVGNRNCEDIGYTGGVIGCTDACRLTTETCSATYFVPGGPTGPDCVAEWQLTRTSGAGRPTITGKTPVVQRCRDGDPACDTDATNGTCTLQVALCFARHDPRVRSCFPRPVASWTLVAPKATASPELVSDVIAAAKALGPSSASGSLVTYDPPLDTTLRCTAPIPIVVTRPSGRLGKLKLQGRATSSRVRDVDTLRLVCTQ